MKRRIGLSLLVVVLLSASALVASLWFHSDWHVGGGAADALGAAPSGAVAVSPATEDEAISLIRSFVGQPDLSVAAVSGEPPRAPGRELDRDFRCTDGKCTFTVDLGLRQVVIATFDVSRGPTGSEVGVDRAREIARAYASPKVPGFDRLALLRSDTMDHGAAGKEYRFDWREQLGSQKARGLHGVVVSVDARAGVVSSFVYLPAYPVLVNVEPTISREDALTIAQQRFGARVSGSEAELRVGWVNSDRRQGQQLQWAVTLISDEPLDAKVGSGGTPILKREQFVIDAHS